MHEILDKPVDRVFLLHRFEELIIFLILKLVQISLNMTIPQDVQSGHTVAM